MPDMEILNLAMLTIHGLIFYLFNVFGDLSLENVNMAVLLHYQHLIGTVFHEDDCGFIAVVFGVVILC